MGRYRSWDDIPNAVRREVAQAAKRGERHHDPEVARKAYDWARTASGSLWKEVPSLAFAVLAGLTGDQANPQIAREEFKGRRLANRVLALGEP